MEQSTSRNKANVTVEKINIQYEGNTVKARRLIVSTIIPLNIQKVWNNVQTPALLQFVAKGMISFSSATSQFPKRWEVGKTYGAKMKIFGFLPFGGIHYLNIVAIDSSKFWISTKEWDKSAKVWNHEVKLKEIGKDAVYYEDSIVIYGGFMTSFITVFAKHFYQHRQKRWQIVARDNLEFGK